LLGSSYDEISLESVNTEKKYQIWTAVLLSLITGLLLAIGALILFFYAFGILNKLLIDLTEHHRKY